MAKEKKVNIKKEIKRQKAEQEANKVRGIRNILRPSQGEDYAAIRVRKFLHKIGKGKEANFN